MAETVLLAAGASAGTAASTAATLGTVATYAGYGLTAFSALGSVQQGAAQKAAAQASARQEELSVRKQRINAEAAKLQAREKYLRTVASARAAYGASGLDVGAGTPLQAETESKSNLQSDINTLDRNAALASLQGREQSAQMRSAGDTAFKSGVYRGLATLGSLATR